MMARRPWMALLSLLCALGASVAPTHAQEPQPTSKGSNNASAPAWAAKGQRPRIGLVLGGGGARGFAHIGALKVLQDNRIPIDCVVGTSIGSLVGAAYAAGRTPDDMAARVGKANWDDLLSSTLPRQVSSYRKKQDDALALIPLELGIGDDLQVKLPNAAISTQKIEFFLRDLTFAGTAANFDALPIPYRAIATDLATGEMVVFKEGDLVTAMRASMAVPGLFPPVLQGERLLVDGGLVRNVPVDVARQTCADVVIAIDVGSEPLHRDELTSVLSFADQYTRLMMIQNVKPQLESLTADDVLISPALGNLSSSDFKKSAELINAGELATLKVLSQLQRYALPADEYAAWDAQRVGQHLQSKPVLAVKVKDSVHVNPEVVKKELDVPLNEPLDIAEFQNNLSRVYARGDFSQLDYELTRDPAGQGDELTVLPIEKSWGPNYLNLGLGFGSDFRNSTPWSFSAQYRRTWMNSLGAEWKTLVKLGSSQVLQSEFYQPLQLDGLVFLSPYLQLRDQPIDLWLGGEPIASYSVQRNSFGVDLGSTLTKYGELRLGAVFNDYRLTKQVGLGALDDDRGRDYGLRLSLHYDQLDNYFFPKEGQYLNLQGYVSLKDSPGSFEDYTRLFAEYRMARPMGKGAWQLTLRGQETTGNAPLYTDIRWLGGFLNMSSYGYQERLTNRFLYASWQYYQPTSWLTGSYWGLGLEFGKNFDAFDFIAGDTMFSAVAYLAYDSFMGPVYLGASYGDNNQATLYFMLGKQF
ncbi:patatin-like phospholipase family protein [Chitinibacter tainanensis]|uniref:patatin-like phospholipase family protein n=1 Tax=Chitinibacter tainanensis TaxID=230667 RepID=UPI0023575ABE|nr:patatin-like phospholipase family protein [Chitinibacter tainanensis]